MNRAIHSTRASINCKELLPASERDWLEGKNIPRDIPRNPARGPSLAGDIIGPARTQGFAQGPACNRAFQRAEVAKREFDSRRAREFLEFGKLSNPLAIRDVFELAGLADRLAESGGLKPDALGFSGPTPPEIRHAPLRSLPSRTRTAARTLVVCADYSAQGPGQRLT